jgi:acyl dehydratase
MSISVARLVVISATAALAATRADAAICIGLALHFAGPAPSGALVAALQQEAAAIWAPYDVELRWQAPVCVVEDASFEVQVARHRPRASGNRTVLGATRFELTHIDRVPVVIDYDATEMMLASLTIEQLTTTVGHWPVGSQELGRALGRVVAHEIGHILLGLPNHQAQGLMRRAFEPIELVFPTRRQYGLSPLEIDRMRHRTRWIIANRNSRARPDSD